MDSLRLEQLRSSEKADFEDAGKASRQKARRAAEKNGLLSKGVVGVLLEGKKNGLIVTIKPLVFALRENGIYLSNSIIAHALEEAGEKQ